MLVATLLVVAAVLFLSIRGIAGFYTDFLWFDSLGLASVWRGVLGARLALGAIFTGVFFVLLWVNLLIADRVAPRFRPSGPEEELLERYYEMVGRRSGVVRIVVSAAFALIAGAGVSQQWNAWVLFTNPVDFGTRDPLFNRDIGFFVFQLPFLSFLVSWLFAAFVIILIVTVVAHYLNGGIRMQTPGQRVTAQVKGHLSVLLGVLALTRAAEYWLGRFELTVSNRGFVDGAAYTDVKAQLPALNLLILISLFSFGLFLFNIKRRGWTLPVVGVGLWALSSVVMGTAYPWFVQRFLVEARGESAKEQPYIARNIEATRAAFGLANVETKDFAAGATLTTDDLRDASEAGTFANVRLLDPEIVSAVYNKRQAQVGYYQFPDALDVDRYVIDGQETLALIGARELNPEGVPQKSWEGLRLIYTQGYGAVISAANEVRSGEPAYVLGGVTPPPIEGDQARTDLSVRSPRLYFSESSAGYALANSGRTEIAFEGDDYNYDGAGGVQMGSYARRAAFALRFNDFNLLASGFVRSDSRMLYVREVRERVQTVAPFLHFDGNPYPVVVDGRIIYVIDGYTTTSRYPYSQAADTDAVAETRGLRHGFNYVRNSVKATVDGFDGTVALYLQPGPDGQLDPIVQAYQKAFPALFQKPDAMPEDLRAHLRHPEDLFRVQTSMYATYHVQDAAQFYNRTGRWGVAAEPISDVRDRVTATTRATAPPVTTVGGALLTGTPSADRVNPQYQLLRLPGDDEASFVLTRPFVPISERGAREEMTAFMAAGENGALQVFRVTSQDVFGPTLLTQRILADREVSEQITLLGQSGSEVRLGNRVLLPINDSLLWVTPMYVRASSGASAVPVLTNVIVSYGQQLVIADNMSAALTELFGNVGVRTLETGTAVTPAEGGGEPSTAQSTTTTSTPPTTTPTQRGGTPTTVAPGATPTTVPVAPGVPQTDQQVLQRAAQLLVEADAALKTGDLGTYQRKVDEASKLVAEQVARTATSQPQPGQA